jgi:hypothetical protein
MTPCGLCFNPSFFGFLNDVGAVILIICITRVAKSSLDKALAENGTELDGKKNDDASVLPIAEPPPDLQEPLVIRIDPSNT